MKILTWNILASEWIKKSYYPTVKDPNLFKREKRIHLVLNTLQKECADILFLQEVMPMEYELVHRAFHRTYRISQLSRIRWTPTNESGNIILVKRGMFKTWVETSFDYGMHVRVDNVDLWNVHLDDISYATRKKQLDQLSLRGKFVILGGDFNQHYKSLLSHLPGFHVHNTCPSYFVEKNMNIDNILTKGFRPLQNECHYLPKSVEEGLSIYGSDHIPVTTILF